MSEPTFRIDSNELWLFGNCGQFVREKCLYLKRSGIGWKKFKEVTLKHFWKIFSFLRIFIIGQTFRSYEQTYCPNLLKYNCASSKRVTNFSEKSVFTWNDLVSAAKSSKECTPNYFSQMFSFFRIFIIGQTFTSDERTYCQNWLKWTVPLWKGWPIS